MKTQRRIQVLAAAVIAAGSLALSSPARADVTAFDGCTDGMALLARRQAACTSAGGSFSINSFWCGGNDFGMWTTCSFSVAPPP